MKLLIAALLTFAAFNAFSSESYNCKMLGPDYLLKISNAEITLSNNLKTFDCEKGFTNLPGTEVELRTLNCANKNQKLSFYFAELDNGDVVLSRNLVLSKDILCKKI